MAYKFKYVLFLALLIPYFSYANQAEPLPTVHIIATGGTIAGASDTEDTTAGTYTAGQVGIEDLISALPGIQTVANVEGEQLFNIDSNQMTAERWLKLAERINQLLASDEVNGIVLTHGTDTMEETAYFLNLTVHSDKPVVLVGSMRPADSLSADGPLNLYNAIEIAASEQAKGKGVLVTLSGEIHSAREVAKTNTSEVSTFKSPNSGKLGEIIYGHPYFYLNPIRKHTSTSEFNVNTDTTLPRVDIIYAYAGIDRTQIDMLVDAGSQGIVIAGTGNGSIPPKLLAGAQDAIKQGVIVVRSSRVGSGIVGVNPAYEQEGKYIFVNADDLNPQKARVLLTLALLHTQDPTEVQAIFDTY